MKGSALYQRLQQPLTTDFFIAGYFVLLPCVKLGGEIFLLATTVFGLGLLARTPALWPAKHQAIRWFALALGGFALLKLISAGWAIAPQLAVRDFFSHLHFLALLPVVVALRKSQAPIASMLLGMRIALVILGLWALSNWLLAPAGTEWGIQSFRAAAQNSGVLGDICAIYLLLNVTAFLFRGQHAAFGGFGATELLLVILCGAIAISATGARTAFLAFFLAASLLVVVSLRQKPFALIGTVSMLAAAAALMFFAQQSRFELGASQARDWMQGKPLVIGEENSIGFRLNLYETAITAIKQRPLIGYGAGNTREVTALFAPEALKKRSLGHFHNQYLQLLTETGVLGIVSAAFIVWCFLKLSAAQGFVVMLGISLVSYELLASLSNNVTKHGVLHSMLLWIYACFCLELLARLRPEQSAR
jgi:O-antigen ligase